MDLRRLELFVALAQELNFTRTARRLHITQSTLSASLKTLESELGATLLTRSTRAVSLTDAGRAFLPRARTAIEALDAARASVSPTGELRGSLTVGMLNGLTLVDVPALAGEFHRRHPQVQLRLETSRRGTAALTEDVVQGRIDVAFAGGTIADPRLRATAIRTYELQLALPKEHPRATRRSLTLEEISDEPFVDMPLGFGQRTVIDAAFAYRSLHRNVVVEVTDLTTVPGYVGNGLGVALLPPAIAVQGGTSIATVPISDADITWTLAVVASAGHPPTRSRSAFLDLVPRYIRPERHF